MPARITDILPLLLITLFCVGVVEGGYLALEYFVLQPSAEQVKPLVPVAAENGAMVKDESVEVHDYHAILQRNLFGPPPGADQSAVKGNADSGEDLQLTSLDIVLMGTINGADGADRAIILDKNVNKQALYETGDAIQGAIVKEILRGKVILAYNGRDEMLDMSEAAKVRPAYAVPVAKSGVVRGADGRQPVDRPAVSTRKTPRRVISRPRVVRPSRSIRKE
jgi:type II secretory pathway component PulC